MKRIVSVIVALMICLSVACPAFATEFVPSIGIKDHPDVVKAEMVDEEGNVIDPLSDDCIVITPVSEAETSTEIPEDARQTLLDVYAALTDGSMEIPYEGDTDMVVRDLFDVSLLCDEHPEMMEQGHDLRVVFDLGVSASTKVDVKVYADGQWHSAVKVVNNGDGTVTVTLDRVGVVAFSVPAGSYEPPAKTGDEAGANLMIWVAMMAVAGAALVVMLVYRRKIVR